MVLDQRLGAVEKMEVWQSMQAGKQLAVEYDVGWWVADCCNLWATLGHLWARPDLSLEAAQPPAAANDGTNLAFGKDGIESDGSLRWKETRVIIVTGDSHDNAL